MKALKTPGKSEIKLWISEADVHDMRTGYCSVLRLKYWNRTLTIKTIPMYMIPPKKRRSIFSLFG